MFYKVRFVYKDYYVYAVEKKKVSSMKNNKLFSKLSKFSKYLQFYVFNCYPYNNFEANTQYYVYIHHCSTLTV